jgi:hypothetical protein
VGSKRAREGGGETKSSAGTWQKFGQASGVGREGGRRCCLKAYKKEGIEGAERACGKRSGGKKDRVSL